jgi:hypothetical protein
MSGSDPSTTGLGTLAADLSQYVEGYRSGTINGNALAEMMKNGN